MCSNTRIQLGEEEFTMGMLHMREQLLRAMLAHAQGEIEKHKANVMFT